MWNWLLPYQYFAQGFACGFAFINFSNTQLYDHVVTSYVAIHFYEKYGITKISFTKVYFHRKITLFMKNFYYENLDPYGKLLEKSLLDKDFILLTDQLFSILELYYIRWYMIVSWCIHVQVLRLSHTTIGKLSSGHIVNLASNDVQRFDLVSQS